jgi:hypothetical protein
MKFFFLVLLATLGLATALGLEPEATRPHRKCRRPRVDKTSTAPRAPRIPSGAPSGYKTSLGKTSVHLSKKNLKKLPTSLIDPDSGDAVNGRRRSPAVSPREEARLRLLGRQTSTPQDFYECRSSVRLFPPFLVAFLLRLSSHIYPVDSHDYIHMYIYIDSYPTGILSYKTRISNTSILSSLTYTHSPIQPTKKAIKLTSLPPPLLRQNPAPTSADCDTVISQVYASSETLVLSASTCLVFDYGTCRGFFCALCEQLATSSDFVGNQLSSVASLCVDSGQAGAIVGEDPPQWDAGFVYQGGDLPGYDDVC